MASGLLDAGIEGVDQVRSVSPVALVVEDFNDVHCQCRAGMYTNDTLGIVQRRDGTGYMRAVTVAIVVPRARSGLSFTANAISG